MMKPTIHLNGTGGKALGAAYERAYDALNVAYDAVRETAPNARDYYPQGPEAILKATADHRARLQKIHDVMNELDILIGHCAGRVSPAPERTPHAV